jgi:hypothetical protein
MTKTTRQSTSPQHAYSPSMTRSPSPRQGNLPQNELASYPYSNVEQTGKNIVRSARQRLEARRQSDGLGVPKRQKEPVAQSPPSPTVNDLKHQLWNNQAVLQSTPPGIGQPSRHNQQTSFHGRETTGASQSLNVRDAIGDSQESARSFSPSRARSFEGIMFQSKYYDAARAALLLDKREKEMEAKVLSRSRSQPIKQPSPRVPSKMEMGRKSTIGGARAADQMPPSPRTTQSMSPRRKSYDIRTTSPKSMSSYENTGPAAVLDTSETEVPSEMGRKSTIGGARAADQMPPSPRMTQSMSPRRKSYDIRTTSPKSTSSYDNTGPAAVLDTSEKEHRLIPKSPVPARGRLATMALQKGLSRGRSPSDFIEKRMRAFSQERRDVPAPAPSATLSKMNSSGHQRQERSLSSDEAPGRIQSVRKLEKSPTKKQPEIDASAKPDASSVRGKRSNITAFWNAKASKEATPPSPKQSTSQPEVAQKSWHGEKEHPPVDGEKASSNRDLMAKLSAVDRGDPAAALAQIDTILREESRNKSFEPILFNNDDDSAAGTTVSSLTNPDYRDSQQHRGVARAIPNKHDVPNQISPNTVTTSAFRRPRPSSLQNYASSIHHTEVQKLPESGSMNKNLTPNTNRVQERLKASPISPMQNRAPDLQNNKAEGPITVKAAKQQSSAILHSLSRLSPRRPHPWDGGVPQSPSIPNNNFITEEESVIIDVDEEVSKHERQEVQQSQRSPTVADDVLKETFAFDKSHVFPKGPTNETGTAARLTPQQYENAKQISENFDAAWASMPEMAFAPAAGDPSTKSETKPKHRSQSTRSSRTVGLGASFGSATSGSRRPHHSRSFSRSGERDNGDVNGERFSIEVSLYDPGTNPSQAGGKDLNDRSKSKRRGFLRSFMRRQNSKKGTASSSTNSESHGSDGLHSGSHTSAGAQSAAKRKKPQSLSAPGAPSLSPSSHQQREYLQRARTNGRSSQPLPRERAESIDKFRTASMAQKYSRVMRLYDDE